VYLNAARIVLKSKALELFWSRNSKEVTKAFKRFDCQRGLAVALKKSKPCGVDPAKQFDSTDVSYNSIEKSARV
jgi:hypothetical protein